MVLWVDDGRLPWTSVMSWSTTGLDNVSQLSASNRTFSRRSMSSTIRFCWGCKGGLPEHIIIRNYTLYSPACSASTGPDARSKLRKSPDPTVVYALDHPELHPITNSISLRPHKNPLVTHDTWAPWEQLLPAAQLAFLSSVHHQMVAAEDHPVASS